MDKCRTRQLGLVGEKEGGKKEVRVREREQGKATYRKGTAGTRRQVGDRRITVAMKGAQGVHENGVVDGDGAVQVRARPSCAREQQID